MLSRNENRNEGTSGCSPGTKPERGYVHMFPRIENRNEGTFAKTPFCETALLSPGEFLPLLICCCSGNQILTLTPNPRFLSKDFCLQPGLEGKFLLRRTRSGQKLFPLQFPGLSLPYKGKPGFLSKDSLLPPRIRENRQMLGVGVESGS